MIVSKIAPNRARAVEYATLSIKPVRFNDESPQPTAPPPRYGLVGLEHSWHVVDQQTCKLHHLQVRGQVVYIDGKVVPLERKHTEVLVQLFSCAPCTPMPASLETVAGLQESLREAGADWVAQIISSDEGDPPCRS